MAAMVYIYLLKRVFDWRLTEASYGLRESKHYGVCSNIGLLRTSSLGTILRWV